MTLAGGERAQRHPGHTGENTDEASQERDEASDQNRCFGPVALEECVRGVHALWRDAGATLPWRVTSAVPPRRPIQVASGRSRHRSDASGEDDADERQGSAPPAKAGRRDERGLAGHRDAGAFEEQKEAYDEIAVLTD